MKYNKSEIMKEAWKLHRSWNTRALTFAQCLTRAWAKAKEAAARAAEMLQKTMMFVNGMTIMADGIELTLNRWQKNGMDRIYINDSKRNTQGYIDIKTGKAYGVRNMPYAQIGAEIALAIAENL